MGETLVSEAFAAPTRPVGSSVALPEHVTAAGQQAARASLRAQITHLETELGTAVLGSFQMRGDVAGAHLPGADAGGPARLLDLGELERVRDELSDRLREVEAENARLRERQSCARERLADMLLEPGRYRFTRISARELGEPGCGVWHVRPRLGLIGMLAGWWQVKLSSGCPLANPSPPAGRGGRWGGFPVRI